MTTSWAHTLRAEWRQALSANVGGVVLAVLALIGAPYCLISSARGKWITRLPSDGVLAAGALTVAAITLGDWALRLAIR